MPDDRDTRFLDRLRLLGFVEGVSTLVLFGVAMPLKYAAGMPLAVTVAGSIHGAPFVALVWMFVRAVDAVPLPRRLATWGVLAAVVPFGPFLLDRHLVAQAAATDQARRRGRP